MKNFLRFFTVATFALCMSLFAISTQAQEPIGSIEGTVKDPQGAIVQGAEVTLKNIATNATRTVRTDNDGRYAFSQLRPAVYELRVSAPNFKQTVISDITVAVGGATPVDVELQVGGASETVTITGGGEAQIDRTENTVSGVVNPRQIQNLPLNGRNFLDLAQLQPGVEKVDGAGFDPTKANYTGVSIGGQAGRSAQIAVDGGSVVDNVVGTTVQNFSQEIVQEFQLATANYDLSTGASATGSVNIISKSGTNQFHGNAYGYFRDSAFAAFPNLSRLDAANGIPLAARADEVPFDRQQWGGTIGGPILKDKLFFFTNYEYNNQDGATIYNPSDPSFAGFGDSPYNETLFTTKVDWNFNSKNNFAFRYSFNDNDNRTAFPSGSGIVPRQSASNIFTSNDQLVFNRSHNFVAGATTAFTPTISNNFVYNFSDFDNRIDPATPNVPEIRIITGGQTFRSGTNAITPQVALQTRNQFRDDLTWAKGSHTFRFGGNYEHTSIGGQFAFAKPVRIRIFAPTGSSEAAFLSASVRDISMGIGDDILPFNTPEGETINHRISVYGGDNWKIGSRFTLNYGLAYRYDSNLWNHDQGHPAIIAPVFGKGTAPSPKDKNNFSPRIGFAWDVMGNGKTVIRGGVGMYYDNTIDNLRLFERADLGPAGSELFLVGADLQSPLLPGGDGRFTPGQITLAQMLALYPAVRANVEANAFNCNLPTSVECFGAVSGPLFSTEFEVPYSIQFAAGVQRELPWNMLLQLDVNYRKGVHEVLVYDVNRHDAITGPRLNRANYDNALPYADSSGYSTYKALLVRLDRRFTNGFQFTASYSLSRFQAFGGDVLGLGAGVTDLDNFRADFGPAGLDRTHRFVFSAIYELPFFKNSSSKFKKHVLGGYTLSLISTTFSGQPQSVFLPDFADLSGTGTFTSYLPGTGPGSIGRSINSVAQLNALIRAYNTRFAGTTDPQGTDLEALAELPANTQLGSDSLISQDLRVTKTFRFTENMKLDLIGEVFNLFNVANLTDVADFTLPHANTPASEITTLRPTRRGNTVFGTGGPRAFQFAVKFSF